MDKKIHKPHTSADNAYEDGGGTKRFKEAKASINKRVVENEIYVDEDDLYHDELEYFIKKMK